MQCFDQWLARLRERLQCRKRIVIAGVSGGALAPPPASPAGP
jgi:hypothetical protein